MIILMKKVDRLLFDNYTNKEQRTTAQLLIGMAEVKISIHINRND